MTWPSPATPVAQQNGASAIRGRQIAVKPLFELGQVVATAGAALALAKARTQPEELLDRHRSGDFGDVGEADRQANLHAVKDGARVVSAYLLRTGEVVLVVTGNRSTTLLTPQELDQPRG